MENQTLNLYTDIYHGAKMGIESIDALMKCTDDEGFKRQLLQTQNRYKQIEQKADTAIQRLGGIPREISAGSRMLTQSMVAMQTMIDDSAQHESKMLKKGFDMAVQELTNSMQNNPDAAGEARDLAFSLLEMQQNELRNYAQFLS